MANENDPETWEEVRDLCHRAAKPDATDTLRKRSQEVLECLGPVERKAFVMVVLHESPDAGKILGKTDGELEALVRSAKEKLGTTQEDEEE